MFLLAKGPAMNDSLQSSWSALMRWRTECWQRFGSALELPIRAPHEELEIHLAAEARVLDVGAGAHMPFRSQVLKANAIYYTLDSDPQGSFDFRSFDEIPADMRFDLVIFNQVLEHMTVETAFGAVRAAHHSLTEGGDLVATVPNTSHPVRQWDSTHITAWPANDLYSLVRSAGFRVTAMARYNKFKPTANPLKRWIVRTVSREFRIDWCDSIMAVATKQP
jgi:hypothetical protein